MNFPTNKNDFMAAFERLPWSKDELDTLSRLLGEVCTRNYDAGYKDGINAAKGGKVNG